MENAAPAVPSESLLSPEEAKALRARVIDAKIANELYLRRHPEIGLVFGEAVRECLAQRPDRPVAFVEDFLASRDLHALHKGIVARQAEARPQG